MFVPRWRRILAASVSAAGAAGVLVVSTPAASAAEPEPDRIYYNAPEQPGRPAAVRVVEFSADRSSYRDIPGGLVGEFAQDGSRITVTRRVQASAGPASAIAVAAPDGTGLRAVSTPDPATETDTDPHWWLDGSILFTRSTPTSQGTHSAVWAAKADGSGERLVMDGAALNTVNPRTGDIITGVDSLALWHKYDPATKTFRPGAGVPSILSGAEHVTFSPDGGKVAFTSGGRLYLGAADLSSVREVLAGTCTNVRGFTWGPNGDRFAVRLSDEGYSSLTVIDLTGRVLRDGVYTGEQGVTGTFYWQPTAQVPPTTPPPATDYPWPEIPSPGPLIAEAPQITQVYSPANKDTCELAFSRSAADGSVWMRVDRSAIGGFDWVRVGGPAQDVAVHPIGSGGLVLAARDNTDGSVHATRNGELPGQWLPWRQIGGPAADVHLMGKYNLKAGPSVLVIARHPQTGAVNYRELAADWPKNGDTLPWENLGGPAADVTVAQNSDGGYVVVARSPADGSVYAREYRNGIPPSLTDWARIGGPARAVSVTYGEQGPVVTAQDPADGSLWTRVVLTEGAPWTKVGEPAYDFTSAKAANGDFAVIARDTTDDHSLWVTPDNHSYNGQWTPQPWIRLDIASNSLPGVYMRTSGTPVIASVTASGALDYRSCDAQWHC